eukprot:3751909-Alexandrium_andersonii.AAC.1
MAQHCRKDVPTRLIPVRLIPALDAPCGMVCTRIPVRLIPALDAPCGVARTHMHAHSCQTHSGAGCAMRHGMRPHS